MKKTLTASLAAACAGVLLTLGPGLPAHAEPAAPSFRLRLSGALNGQFHIPQVQWARVQSDPARTQASLGLFTDPPSDHLPFDLAVVLGDFHAAALQPGRYNVLPLHRDMPAAVPDGKRGFMVLVPTGQQLPRAEYVTRSGEFIVDTVDSRHIAGRFVLQLATADGSRTLQAEGDFQQTLD